METSFAIQNVTVKSKNGKLLFHTNKEGLVNIRNFRKKDTLYFSHPDYEDYAITKREILRQKNKVDLIKRYQKLDNVILSVSRTKSKKNRIARQVLVIDRNETEKTMPATSGELLRLSGNIMVQKTQGGAGSPIVRGLEANRVLLVIDGVRLNNAISRTGHMHTAISINPLTLERTEIIYGPSSIYGSDALGGVINFYTKTPVVNRYKKFSLGLTGKFATVNNETGFHLNSEYSAKNWATSFGFSYTDFGNIRMGQNRVHGYKDWGIVKDYSQNDENTYYENSSTNNNLASQPHTSFNQKDIFNKTIFRLGNRNELIFNTQYNISSPIDRFDKLSQYNNGNLKYAEWRYGTAERFLFSPQLILRFDKKWLKKAKIILAYQDLKESRIWRKFSSFNRNFQEENIKVLSLNADFNTRFSKKRTLSYGLEGTYNKVKSVAQSKILQVSRHDIIGYTEGDAVPTRYPDGSSNYSSFAAYGNYRFNIGKKSSLNTGLRFTQTHVHVNWDDNTFIILPYNNNELANFAFTGNLSYILTLKDWKMSSIFSSGFRSPNIDDIGKIREKKGKVTVPNIYLKPEYALNGEFSLTKFFNKKNFNISVDGYYSYLYHYIARDKFELQPGQDKILYNGEWVYTYANVNEGDAEIYGGSLTLSGKITNNFRLKGGIFYTQGRMIDKKRPMPSIPPFYGNTKLTYKFQNFETAVLYRFMLEKPIDEYDTVSGIDNLDESPIDPISGEYVGFPQWHILSWYGTYHFTKNISINLAVENIFDIHYREFASSISAPGRNIKVQFTTKL
jgi:hemoglobin/transferrin/lactoferrin receptor protein